MMLKRGLGLLCLVVASPLACSAASGEDARVASDESGLGVAAWSAVGTAKATAIAAATSTDGNPALFTLNGGSATMYSIGANGWAATGLGGSLLQSIAVGHNADGRLELFAIGGDGALYHRWQTDRSNDWGGWQNLTGSQLQRVVTDNEADGRLVAFVLGGDGNVYRIGQTSANGGWGTWSYVGGGPFSQIATGHDPNGALELLGLTTGGTISDIQETAANGAFGAWTSLGEFGVQQLAVGENADGRIEAYVRAGGALYHRWRTTSGGWTGSWASLGGSQLRDLAVASEANGSIDAFAVGGDSVPYETQQNGPNLGWGGTWLSLGDGSLFTKLVAGRTSAGLLRLFGLMPDGTIRTTYQQTANGPWVAPPSPPPACSPGSAGTVTIDAFTTPSGDGIVNYGDDLFFKLTAQRYSSTAGLENVLLDGAPVSYSFAANGVAGTAEFGPPTVQIVTSALSGTTHTIAVPSPSCGNATSSVTLKVAMPTAPAATLHASSTYVNVGAPVTLMPSVSGFRPRDCQNAYYGVVGTDYTGKVVFQQPDVRGSVTVHPTDETFYASVVGCRNYPAAGTTTSSKIDVKVYSPPPASEPFFCFTITTPDTESQPGSCWAEAIQAADESTAESIETNRNGGNAAVTSDGQCTSIPTNACPLPFPEE